MNNEGITLKEIVDAVFKKDKLLLIIFAFFILLSVLYYFIAPKSYTADATLIVTATSPISGLSSLMNVSGMGMPGSTTNIIFAVLGSRTIAEAVLEKIDVSKAIMGRQKTQMDAVGRVKLIDKLRDKIVKSYIGKNGVIKIEASLTDQKKVADLVNQYIEELYSYVNSNGINLSLAVIDKAEVPLLPSAPRLFRILFVGLVAACMVSAIILANDLGVFKK